MSLEFDKDWSRESQKEDYFDYIVRIKEDAIKRGILTPTLITKLKSEMAKTGLVDGEIKRL